MDSPFQATGCEDEANAGEVIETNLYQSLYSADLIRVQHEMLHRLFSPSYSCHRKKLSTPRIVLLHSFSAEVLGGTDIMEYEQRSGISPELYYDGLISCNA